MILRRAVLSLLLAALTGPLVAPIPARAETPLRTLRIATEGAFPPYNALDAAGRPVGFEIDLGTALCARTGMRCEWVIVAWPALIPGLLAGDYDAIMAGMSVTPGRARQVAFSREYFPSADAAVGMFVGTHTFQTPDQALIAVQSDTIHEDHLRARGLRVQTHPTAGAALAAVLDGAADLVFGSPDFLELRVYRTSRSLAIIGTEEISAGGAAIALRPGDTDLLSTLNAALDALGADGTLDRLNRTWFEPSRDI